MNEEKFSTEEREILNAVWNTYGGMSANALEAQTHTEAPWRKARAGVDEFTNSNAVLRNDDMTEYYRELYDSYQGE